MDSIRVRICQENVCSCNNCGAKNYKSAYDKFSEPVHLWDVKIGTMVSRLCRGCMKQLADAVELAVMEVDE